MRGESLELNRPQRGRDVIVTRTFAGLNEGADWPRTRTGYGHGLCAAADWKRTRSWRGCGLASDWTRSRTGHGHGQQAGHWRGHPAAKPRPLCGHKILRCRRSKACTVLHMMRNALALLLQQFDAPLFQLPNHGLNAGDLLDFRHSDSCGEAITEMRVW